MKKLRYFRRQKINAKRPQREKPIKSRPILAVEPQKKEVTGIS